MSAEILFAIVLSVVTLASGLFALRLTRSRNLQFVLVFSGGYLFSITVVHLLPEIFSAEAQPAYMGILLLVGFYFQQVLEFFTQGVEHGHVHEFSNNHNHGGSFAASTLIALCVHALLEGTILDGNMDTVLIGILLHKIPASIALVTVLRCYPITKGRIVLLLSIFALSSPLGIGLGSYLDSELSYYLLALVGGSFLQISTTIVFETSADHTFNFRKLVYGLAGAALAVIAEYYVF